MNWWILFDSGRESSLTSRRVGSGRITGRESEPSLNSTVKDIRERREPLRTTNQRERTFDRDQQQRSYPSRTDVRDKGMDKDRRNYDRSGGYERDYSRGNRYQVIYSFIIVPPQNLRFNAKIWGDLDQNLGF